MCTQDASGVREKVLQYFTFTGMIHFPITPWKERIAAGAWLDMTVVEDSSFGGKVHAMEVCRDDLKLIFEALLFAAEKHKDQRRKGVDASPYINHPIAVAHYLTRYCDVVDVRVVIAAILHDTLEDTDTTPQEIEEKFGPDVLRLVQEVTDDKNLPREVRRKLQVKTVGERSPGAKLIRLADKISNVTDLMRAPPPNWDEKTRIDYLDWTEQVIGRIKGVNSCLERLYDERLKRARGKFAV
jgi:guanosine-3',5'-bis(diphosphate) 3'-pyrophosphohydrolase